MAKKKKSYKPWIWAIAIVLVVSAGFIFLTSDQVLTCEPAACDAGYTAGEVTCADGWCSRPCTSGMVTLTRRCEIEPITTILMNKISNIGK
jgi:hypothetical protein